VGDGSELLLRWLRINFSAKGGWGIPLLLKNRGHPPHTFSFSLIKEKTDKIDQKLHKFAKSCQKAPKRHQNGVNTHLKVYLRAAGGKSLKKARKVPFLP
jgi:hypothetical protein